MKFAVLPLLLAALILPAQSASGGEPNLVPWPRSVEMAAGQMPLAPTARIVAEDASLAPLAGVLAGVASQRLLPRLEDNGRIPAFEVMVANPAIRNIIRENRMHQAQSILETSRQDGMVTMDAALRGLFDQGLISYQEALLHVRNPKNLGPQPNSKGK